MVKNIFKNKAFTIVLLCCLLFFYWGCTVSSDSDKIPLPTSTGFGIATETVCNYEEEPTTEIFTGDLLEDTTWSGCQRIMGYIRVKDGIVLTIEAGTTILASTLEITSLIIQRGGMIQAIGTFDEPIEFTSGRAVGVRRRGDWGGITINGKSQYNNGNADDGSNSGEGEGNSGTYGGNTISADNSGQLSYVSISFSGRRFTTENELNGLALQAVGSETTIDHIHLHQNSDDGLEIFGGTVNLKYIISSYNGDDQIDWTSGWQGNLQYALLLPLSGDRGIEGDNNSNDNSKTPNSNPTLRNVTIAVSEAQNEEQEGILLRVGTMADIANLYISGFAKCISVEGRKTTDNVNDSSLVIRSFLFENCGIIDIQTTGFELGADLSITTTELWALQRGLNVMTPDISQISPVLFDNISDIMLFYPLAVSPGTDSSMDSVDGSGADNNRRGGGAIMAFEAAEYIGAFNTSAPGDWLTWTSFPAN